MWEHLRHFASWLHSDMTMTWQWHDNDMTMTWLSLDSDALRKMGIRWVPLGSGYGGHILALTWRGQGSSQESMLCKIQALQALCLQKEIWRWHWKQRQQQGAQGKPEVQYRNGPKVAANDPFWGNLIHLEIFGDIWRYLEIFGDIWRPGRSGTECWVLGVLSRFFGGSQRSILCASLCHDSWVL